MDPAYLISPPRAHPSGSLSGIDESSSSIHRKSNVMQETWFMALVVTTLLAILISAATVMLFFRRRHQLTKELGHLSGKLFLTSIHCFLQKIFKMNDYMFNFLFYSSKCK